MFGGFTQVKWASRKSNCHKSNNSLRSFLFTLKNPHSVPLRKCALRVKRKQDAIYDNSERGSGFGAIVVSDNCNCNANKNSYTCFGTRWRNSVCVNDTAAGNQSLPTQSTIDHSDSNSCLNDGRLTDRISVD
jgi:hypothetical protein